MNESDKYTLEDIIKMDAIYSIKKCFPIYGIEGTEDAIKRVYRGNSKALKYMLTIYQEIIKEK